MDKGKTGANQQQDKGEGVDSIEAEDSMNHEMKETAAMASSSAAVASSSAAPSSSEEDNDKVEISMENLQDSTQEENVTPILNPIDQSKAAQNQSSEVDQSEKNGGSQGTVKQTEFIKLHDFVASTLEAAQETAVSSNTDQCTDAAVVETVSHTAVAETVENVAVGNARDAQIVEDKSVAAIIEDKSGAEIIEDKCVAVIVKDKSVAEIIEDESVAEIIEDKSVAEIIEDKSVAEIIEDKSVAEIIEDKSVAKIIEDKSVAETVEDAAEDAVISTNDLGTTFGSSIDEGTPAHLTLVAGDNEEHPVSPSSDKEIDLSDDRALQIDESEVSHSEDVADVSHTNSRTVDSVASDNVGGSSLNIPDKSNKPVERSENEDGGGKKELVPNEKNTCSSKNSSSIEDSIERCIANNTTESLLNDAPLLSPSKKRAASVTPKPPQSEKFPRNYGFKIITNKIDLCTGKATFSTIPKLEASGIPLKKIKIKAKPLADSAQPLVVAQEGIMQENNAANDVLSPQGLAKGIAIAFRKSTDESGDSNAPKERPTTGLKVRDVESINAAIRTVKAPVSQVFPDDSNKFPGSISNANEKLPDKETTNHVNDRFTEVEPELTISALPKPGLRAIAPKCEPIATNDPQTIKLIRDLIQLPSVPVYVPDVSDSKHFNGRLHLCHGCGDRFVLLKSLLEHQNRRSCVIKFQCLKCDSIVLCFFNRCEFIRHLYNHNQTLTTVMLQYHITVERLPVHNSGIFDVKICQECKVFLKIPLPEHMQGLEMKDKTHPDFALKCQWCSLLLPSKCAYQAHRRMHFLQPPHVCPECGDMSPDLPSFNVHINSVCFHTSKRSLFVCSHCKAEMFDARKLERHIRTKHIRDVFKCNFCFVACFNLKDLDKHRHQHHEAKVAEEGEDNDESGLKYAFHLCDMCPNRLIRRVRLGQHVWDHTYSHNDVTYVYECRKCKVNFSSKEILSGHAAICSAGSSSASTQAFATVVANGSDIVVHPPTSDMIVLESSPTVTDSNAELQSDFAERAHTLHIEENDDDMMVIDESDVPPLQKAPVVHQVTQAITQPVTQSVSTQIIKSVSTQIIKPVPQRATQSISTPIIQPVTKPITQLINQPMKVPATLPEKKKKKKPPPKKPPPKPQVKAFRKPSDDNSFNSFENELFMDADDLDAEEGGMEVVLNCLECGTNLTSELGSYCTLCEQKREAGSDTFKTATPNPLLDIAKKKVSKKIPTTGGNFSCRICNALISRTCDKAAIKRHFISKHKEIFIAALQTGMNATANKNGPKLSRPNILSHKRSGGPSTQGSTPKKSSAASLGKISKKKKKTRKPSGHVSQSDSEDSVLSTSPSKEGKKAKDKRKRSYSPSFPALEQGMVASEEKETETKENIRYCYKCSFKSSDKEEFMTHVTTHKTNPKDLQCPACGMCFVVRPSLEKHLLILHGMKNVDEYLLEHGFAPVDKTAENVDAEMLDVNQCKVCHMKFDSEALLEKHFRTHGGAFLLSKQFRRS